jgi:hypothetical protein
VAEQAGAEVEPEVATPAGAPDAAVDADEPAGEDPVVAGAAAEAATEEPPAEKVAGSKVAGDKPRRARKVPAPAPSPGPAKAPESKDGMLGYAVIWAGILGAVAYFLLRAP